MINVTNKFLKLNTGETIILVLKIFAIPKEIDSV